MRFHTCFCNDACMLPFKDCELQRGVFSGRTRACTPVFLISAVGLSTIAVVAGSPPLLMTNSVYSSLLMKLLSCPIAYLSSAFFPGSAKPRGSGRHVHCTQNRRPRILLHRIGRHVIGRCIFMEETEVDLNLSCFSHCWTAKMRRISTLAQSTREAPGIVGSLRVVQSPSDPRVCLGRPKSRPRGVLHPESCELQSIDVREVVVPSEPRIHRAASTTRPSYRRSDH